MDHFEPAFVKAFAANADSISLKHQLGLLKPRSGENEWLLAGADSIKKSFISGELS
jgi:hypothetical protein